ncbi:DMT family transporter [Nocardia sp. NPDC057272]|uniref:DMT family transporter n=1 Tax=Nocardia sp. NPDC057272 TaxID=3346079 RepID=UPI00363A7FAC
MSVSLSARTGTADLVVAGILWGTGGLLGTLVQRSTGLSPIAVAAVRLAVGGLLLVGLCVLTRRAIPRGAPAWRRIGAIAVLAPVFQGCYFGAVALSSVSLATLITIGMSPVVVALAEYLTGRRALDRTRACGMALALTGLALLVGAPGADGARALWGAAMALGAATAFAVLTVIAAVPVTGLDPVTGTGVGFTAGAILLALPAAMTSTALDPNLPGILGALALGLFPTAIAYTRYFRGLTAAGAGTGALLALLEPLTGTLLAVLLLDERLGLVGWFGAALLSLALVTAGRAAGDPAALRIREQAG